MKKLTNLIMLACFLTSCTPKKEEGMKKTAGKTVNIEQVVLSEMKRMNYIKLACPVEEVGGVPEAKDICFAGNGAADAFINSLTKSMTPYLSGQVFWERDFGLWHTKFGFTGTEKALVIQLMVKGDFDGLVKLGSLKEFDNLVIFSIFDHE